MQLTSLKKQQGASILGILIVVLMMGLIGFFALKVGPTYLENWTLGNMMEALETDKDIAGSSPNKLQAIILKRTRVNGVYNLTPKNLKIIRQGAFNLVTLEYVVAKKLVGNMEVVMTFSESAQIPASR